MTDTEQPVPVERERFAAMLDALEAAYDYGSQERIAAARAACLAAFDAVSADAERLDWLEGQRFFVARVTDSKLDNAPSIDIDGYEYAEPTFREAIDAARAHQEDRDR